MIRCWGCDFFSFFLASRVLVVDMICLFFLCAVPFGFGASIFPRPFLCLFFVMAIYYLCCCSIPDPTRHAQGPTIR